MLRFLVFRNVVIAACALCMSCETIYFCGLPVRMDAFAFFIFASTFFIYNFHAYANHLVHEPFKRFFHLLDKEVSLSQRVSVGVGFVGAVASFWFISFKAQLVLVFLGLITLAYTLPIIKVKGRRWRLR